jgi:hypothetical protein
MRRRSWGNAVSIAIVAVALFPACDKPDAAEITRADEGCMKDTDCKGDRICDQGRCTAPPITGTPACPPCPACPDPATTAALPPPDPSLAVGDGAVQALRHGSTPALEKARALLLDHPDQAKLILYDRLTKGGTVEELVVLKQACKATSDQACVAEVKRRLNQ